MKNQSNFIKTIMEKDLESGKHKKIITRFPPEPNGFLHIGHARAIIINFELAKHFGGITNLRFDDTNPEKEESIYIKSIKEDIKWLGYKPNEVRFASSYFEEMYERALIMIKKGVCYVSDLSAEEISKTRGTLTSPGKLDPNRNRSIEENLKLFNDMKNAKFKEGEKVLRAKIDMASPNMNMRDPVVYRISYEKHATVGNKWVVYPMYDYAHPLEDAIEGITHSLCSLEFEDHRPLYDWFVKQSETPHVPRQIEFGRLNINRTVMSKRYINKIIETGFVSGWDDPRLATLKGLRRRGVTPEAIKNFILATGLSKTNNSVDQSMFDAYIRNDLETKVDRVMVVKDPLKVVITNYKGKPEILKAELNKDRDNKKRNIYFGKEIYIEREDFQIEKPNRKYKRLYLGGEVRLMNAYFIKANDIKLNQDGSIKEIYATYDPKTKSGSGFNERKPNGTIHFVEKTHAIPAVFNEINPLLDNNEDEKDFLKRLNPNSLIKYNGYCESYLKKAKKSNIYQFIRDGYYCVDTLSTPDNLIFNRTVPLKSSYK